MFAAFSFVIFCNFLFQIRCDTFCKYQFAIEESTFRNKVLRGHIYRSIPDDNPSSYFCFDSCMRDTRCRSINVLYNTKRICQLNDMSRNDALQTDLVAQENSTFYDLDSAKIAKVPFNFTFDFPQESFPFRYRLSALKLV